MYITHFKEDNSDRTILKILYHSEHCMAKIYLFVCCFVSV